MPSQLIPFKVVRSPIGSDYEYNRDVVGVLVPLFYHDAEAYGNLFSYLPYEFRSARYENSAILALRYEQNTKQASFYKLYDGVKTMRWESYLSKFSLGEKEHRKDAIQHLLTDAEHELNEVEYLELQSAAFNHLYESFKHDLYTAGKAKPTVGSIQEIQLSDKQATSTTMDVGHLIQAEELVAYKEMQFIETLHAAQVKLQKDILIDDVIQAEEYIPYRDISVFWLYDAIQKAKTSGEISNVTYAVPSLEQKETFFLEQAIAGRFNDRLGDMIESVRPVKYLKPTKIEEMSTADVVDLEGYEVKAKEFGEKESRRALEKFRKFEKLGEKQGRSSNLRNLFQLGKRNPKDSYNTEFKIFGKRNPKTSEFFNLKRFLNAEKEGRGASIFKYLRFDTIREKRGAAIEQIRNDAEKIILDTKPTDMSRLLTGILDYRDAYIDRNMFNVNRKERDASMEELLLARFGSKEAVMHQTLLEMQKEGVLTEFVHLILSDDGVRDSKILEKMMADGKNELDSLLHEMTIADKGEKESIFNKLLFMLKAPKNSGWIQETVFATMHDTTKQFVVEYLKDAEKPSIEGLSQYLKQSELADLDRDAIMSELELAWNKDKPNRPAGMMNTMSLGHWDIGWDDVMDQWQPGWDYLDVPGRDYNYDSKSAEIYDKETGIPYNPLSPVDELDVEVETPITHPFEEWSDIGVKEAWVEIFTFQDVIINMLGIQRDNKLKIAGMTTQQALQFVLRELYIILDNASILNDQYQRMFRFVRWYAEMITMRDSKTILRRVYEDWKDTIATKGTFGATHSMQNMIMQNNGVIESTAASGFFSFKQTSPIKTTVTFSTALTLSAGSTGKIYFYIDNVLIKTYDTPGVIRESFEVSSGEHEYKLLFTLGDGDMARFSGFVIENTKFIEAYTEQVDGTEPNGLKSFDILIQELMKYYMNHHLNKVKGATNIKQRKIWLN